MNGPILVIRADASAQGGAGHIMRTLAYAQEWVSRGGRCVYICSTLPDKLKSRLHQETCTILKIDAESGSQEDALQTSNILQEIAPHWLMLDSYHLASSYQKSLSLHKRTQVIALSDFGIQDFHKPRIIIHPNIAPSADYSSLTYRPTILTGADYTPIRKELNPLRKKSTTPRPSNILISMGGSDPLEVAETVSKHLINNRELENIKIRLILGPAYPSTGKAHQLKNHTLTIIHSPSSMHEHYNWADTIICSPSTTALEASYYGLAIGLILVADNQHNILKAMQTQQAALSLGDASINQLALEHLDLLLNPSEHFKLSNNAASLIDGRGAKRVCQKMGLPEITLRKANKNDAKSLHTWSNDPVTRKASFNTELIPWEQHILWFDKQLANDSSYLLITEDTHQNQYGVVRFSLDQSSNEATISISLDQTCRGKGLAPIIINKAADFLFQKYHQYSIIAWIKPQNKASLQSFIRAGFQHSPSSLHPDKLRMKLNNPS